MAKKHHMIKRHWSQKEKKAYHRRIVHIICRARGNPEIPVDPSMLGRIAQRTKGMDYKELETGILKKGFKIGGTIKPLQDIDINHILEKILDSKEPLIRAHLLNQTHRALIYKFRNQQPIKEDIGNVRALLSLLQEKKGRKSAIEQGSIMRLKNLLSYLESRQKKSQQKKVV